ncbi:MAG: cell envelope integrity protein TolA [Treponema sp.]|nr:cell envelope integrity protein TolA [Treponema sp.]
MKKVIDFVIGCIFAGIIAGCATSKGFSTDIEYQEVSNSVYFASNRQGQSGFSKDSGAYKISGVSFGSIEKSRIGNMVSFSDNKHLKFRIDDYLERTGQSVEGFWVRFLTFTKNEAEPKITIYVREVKTFEIGTLFLPETVWEFYLDDIEGLPTQEQLDAVAAEKEAEKRRMYEEQEAARKKAEEERKAAEIAKLDAQGKALASGYVYHGVEEAYRNEKLFLNSALEPGHAYVIKDFTVRAGGSYGATVTGDGFIFRQSVSGMVSIDYVSQKVKADIAVACGAVDGSVLGMGTIYGTATVVVGGTKLRPVILGIIDPKK